MGGGCYGVNNYISMFKLKYKSSFNKQQDVIKASGGNSVYFSFSDNSLESWEVAEDKMVSRRAILSR